MSSGSWRKFSILRRRSQERCDGPKNDFARGYGYMSFLQVLFAHWVVCFWTDWPDGINFRVGFNWKALLNIKYFVFLYKIWEKMDLKKINHGKHKNIPAWKWQVLCNWYRHFINSSIFLPISLWQICKIFLSSQYTKIPTISLTLCFPVSLSKTLKAY